MNAAHVSLIALLIVLAGLVREADAEDPPQVTQGGVLTIAKVTDANQFLAYSKKAGDWKKHTFPAGAKALPIVSGSVCAFRLSGDEITELVAVDQRGNWRSVKLAMPTGSECIPIVSNEVAVYAVNGHVYAFSAITGTWDSIQTRGTPYIEQDTAMILTADTIAVFSSATGKWAAASLKSSGK